VIFINNAVYGMTGGQMAPTTMPDQRTTTSPFGRKTLDTGMPVKMSELLASLETPAYITRQTLLNPKYINKAKKAKPKKRSSRPLPIRCKIHASVLSNWSVPARRTGG
jgi:2-oxoglutarate ferredoxin oxidoreductase subunit beta